MSIRRGQIMRSTNGLGRLLVLAVALATGASARAQMSYLDNGTIKIGVDLGKGGSITYLSNSGSTQNIINSADLGRQVQQSYYSGPDDYDPLNNQHPNWDPWPWNPIQSGDCYNNRGTVLEHSNNGTEIYLKSVPKQWALSNVPGEATFESWIRLEGRAARVRARLNNARTDTTQFFDARHQELPAVYTVGTLHRLFTYQGTAPWSNGPLTDKGHVPPPWTYWRATESWAALVNNSDWGLGVYSPGTGLFIGGFYGTPGTGGPNNSQTGYISPLHTDHLDHNIVYEYAYSLILGSLSEIRAWVYQQPRTAGPHYAFQSDRQHWHYLTASDEGFPVNGRLRVSLNGSNPRMIGPPCAFYAAEVPRIYVRAAYHTISSPTPTAELYWELNNEGTTGGVFRSTQRVQFSVIPDGAYRTYAVNVASAPNYSGLITQLRFDPAFGGAAGEYADVQFISTAPTPEITLSTSSIVRSIQIGSDLPADTFTVANSGGATLQYTISDDAPWLSVAPDSGTSTGEPDSIGVTYGVAGLALGTYAATITVADPNAINSPQNIAVTCRVVPTFAMRSDFDDDGDVDVEDFGRFQLCYTDTGQAPPVAACADADQNEDGLVDRVDFTIFQACLSGPGRPASPSCGR